jgi:hypothetical protein
MAIARGGCAGNRAMELNIVRARLSVIAGMQDPCRLRAAVKSGKLPVRRSRGTLVHVVQARQDSARTDGAGGGAGGGMRGLPREAPVRALRVGEADELLEHRPQVPLVDDDAVVQAFTPEGPHDSFGDGVGVKRQLPLMPTERTSFGSRTRSIRSTVGALSW